jgi:hypothetical protein
VETASGAHSAEDAWARGDGCGFIHCDYV